MRTLSVVCGVVAAAVVASACQDSRALGPNASVASSVGAKAHAFTVLQVTPISGPDTVGSNETATFSATASGGVAPYTYLWFSSPYSIDGPTNGTSAKIFWGCMHVNGLTTVVLTVTDAENDQVQVQKDVHTLKDPEPC
jgi:hypothetical protein